MVQWFFYIDDIIKKGLLLIITVEKSEFHGIREDKVTNYGKIISMDW